MLRTRRPLYARRWRLLLYGLSGAILLGLLPLDRHVSAPAAMGPIAVAPLVAGDPARVERVLARGGQRVTAGTALVELVVTDMDTAAALCRLRFLAAPGPLRPVRGTLSIDAEPQSVIGQLLGSIMRIVRAKASLTAN